ncbi:hypothetical protein IFM89_000180 [Coptis chinensis]|uniref:Uncharacterized protein n=1 Tax=Coptis chinensis TaxID=261450 RepID=A0A835I9X9_9MAGN|nr:hypothetical protein IFM89_000180 [Coptis chinensis]
MALGRTMLRMLHVLPSGLPKVHLFDINTPGDITFKESDNFTSGDRPTVVDTSHEETTVIVEVNYSMIPLRSLPFDYVKTQIQKMQPNATGKYPYNGSLDCVLKTRKAGGALKFYTGFPVYCVKIAHYVKTMELNGQELYYQELRLDYSRPRGSFNTPQFGKTNSYHKGGQRLTVFVRVFDTSGKPQEFESTLQEHSASCGEVVRVSLPKDYELGALKGAAKQQHSESPVKKPKSTTTQKKRGSSKRVIDIDRDEDDESSGGLITHSQSYHPAS